MRPAETVVGLAAFERRGAGSDAERRAAKWLAQQLESARRAARLEPFWCRPNWALAHAWHVALGLAGSLLSVATPRVGGTLVLAALISILVDDMLGVSPGRRLTAERASQNVVSIPTRERDPRELHLIITANYDAGRTGLAYRDWMRAPFARLHNALGRRGPGWLGWLVIALIWVLVVAILRLDGDRGTVVGLVQLVPTVGLVLALALLLELGTAHYGPAANDNSTGTAVALSLAQALDAAPPKRMAVEVVLQGAGDGFGIGLRRHLRARRQAIRASNTVVLGIAASGAGEPRWWISDGQLVPLRYFRRLVELLERLHAQHPHLGASGYRGRGATPALRARAARLPAIAIGCVDRRCLIPRSHQRSDQHGAMDPTATDAVVQVGLMLVDEIDALLRSREDGDVNAAAAANVTSHRRHRVVLGRPLPLLGRRQRKTPDQFGP